jgi:hypothetical protein
MLYSFDQSTGAIVVKELASESAIEEPRAPVAELPLEPRTHLDGLQIPANFVLPSLVSVRVDAVRCKFQCIFTGPLTDRLYASQRNEETAGTL